VDARPLVIHPAATTHAQLPPAEQLKAEVEPEMVCISSCRVKKSSSFSHRRSPRGRVAVDWCKIFSIAVD